MNEFPLLQNIDYTIDNIELFRFDTNVVRHFSFGTWRSRQHAFLKIGSGNCCGWGENVMSVNNEEISLEEWGKYFSELKGLTVSQALKYVSTRLDVWEDRRCEMAEMALVDLAGKLTNQSALTLLNLEGKNPVPGVYVILDDNVENVKQLSEKAIEQNLTTHVKLKLFGDNALDIKLIQAIREVLGNDTFIIGDVNCGYRTELSERPVDDIAYQLNKLYQNGLNACEDPAKLTNEQWIVLQKQVGNLELIPDYPMRPAISAIQTVRPGMGKIYNIHPGCTGSILQAVQLGKKVKEIGGKLMIGDDSLLGPGCTGWQQIAIGLSADWVEALEKPNESDGFLDSVKVQATAQGKDSKISAKTLLPGFGLEIDEQMLKQVSFCHIIF